MVAIARPDEDASWHSMTPEAVATRLEVDPTQGLDGAEARRVLEGDEYADDVRGEETEARQMGIHSVPAVIINDRHLISGGQPPEVFEQALRQIAAAS